MSQKSLKNVFQTHLLELVIHKGKWCDTIGGIPLRQPVIGIANTRRGSPMALSYNQPRFSQNLLSRYKKSSPSFAIDLYDDHWTLNKGPSKFLYSQPVSVSATVVF